MDKKLYVVGIGPGGYEEMTLRAAKVLQECEQIVGYSVYLDLIRQYFPGKAFYATPMREEVQRCQHALAMAGAGKRTAILCSGDAGVYGMAGLVYALRGRQKRPRSKWWVA